MTNKQLGAFNSPVAVTAPNTNDPQLTRTVNGRDWGAWRLQIMKGGNAYRLHYWHSEGEYVLSDVASKNARPKPCPIDEKIVAQIQRDV